MEDNNQTLVVSIRRCVRTRIFGDSVVHWEARNASTKCSSTGRSLARAEREFRRYLATLPGWDETRANSVPITFELRDACAETNDALATRTRALVEAHNAAAAARVATENAIRALLVGTPAVSVRDTARLLGVSKWEVQRVASAHGTGAAGKSSRAREREAALEARIHPSKYNDRRKMLLAKRGNRPLWRPPVNNMRRMK